MSYNGAGVFVINSTGQPVVTGTVISSTAFNSLTADLATGLSTAITTDGQSATTVRIPFAAGIDSSLTTDATSIATGSVITAGGVGVAKALWVGGLANIAGVLTTIAQVITSASANAFAVGRVGTNNPAFNIDASTALSVTGVNIKAAANGGGVAVSVLSLGTNEALTVNAKGSGAIGIGSISTGAVTITPATTISGATTLSSTLGVTGVATLGNGAILGTPASATLTNATGLPISSGVSGLGTGVATALAVNVGSAGAPVVNGGALGTPSSGTITNLTGTASININGTVGATTPAAVAATTLSASGTATLSGTLAVSGPALINSAAADYNEKLKITFPNTQAIHCNESTSSSSVNFVYFTKGSGLTNVGAIFYNGSVMAYQTSSDYRLKENVAPMTGALAKIALLNPVTYTWKDNRKNGDGFIAHELQEHFSDAVSGKKDEVDADGNPKYQGMDASILIATLTAAIQELKAIIDTQAIRIDALEPTG